MKIPEIILLPTNRVWRAYFGGKVLDILEGKESPTDSHFPEDWIASIIQTNMIGREDYPEEGLSRVIIEGDSFLLRDIIEQYPAQILGDAHYKINGAKTQFLSKFLDSSIRLPIQCHPSREFAKKYLNSNAGKTEAYYILETRPEIEEPYFFLGFQYPPTPEEFKEVTESQDIDKMLTYFEKIPVKSGDVIMVPGGFPHAIGEGIFMIEIMEPTDFCVRAEFEMAGYTIPEENRFMNRGIDFALSMYNYQTITKEEILQTYFLQPRRLKDYNAETWEEILIDESNTPCFRINKLHIRGKIEKNEDTFYVGIVISGEAIITKGKKQFTVKKGDKFLVPAWTKKIYIEASTITEIICVFPPK